MYLWVLDCWFHKTRYFNASLWPWGTCNGHFSHLLNILSAQGLIDNENATICHTKWERQTLCHFQPSPPSIFCQQNRHFFMISGATELQCCCREGYMPSLCIGARQGMVGCGHRESSFHSHGPEGRKKLKGRSLIAPMGHPPQMRLSPTAWNSSSALIHSVPSVGYMQNGDSHCELSWSNLVYKQQYSYKIMQ